MLFEDKSINCKECQQAFTFTAGEQEFYASKNLQNQPLRCQSCRVTQRFIREGKDPSQCSDVPCDTCGANARVPFKPTGARPVYCSACFIKSKVNTSSN
ncbi:MAG: zinc-ribbon domain containing protein [Candidatus Melainabacteria bacterium]|nr:zinc-ribbon domain containing protein [Candidatus Melainabacteria bacterium]